MTEIDKMFENAGIKKEFEKPAECSKNPYITCDGCMLYDDKKGKCNNRKDYPPFTAEKQLFLIQWLAETRPIHINFLFDKWTIEGMVRYGKKYDTFEYALSGYINQIWQDLTDQEKEKIRNILNENS